MSLAVSAWHIVVLPTSPTRSSSQPSEVVVMFCCLSCSSIVSATVWAVRNGVELNFTSDPSTLVAHLHARRALLGGAVEKFHLLRYGLAFVLVFVGLKMVWLDEWYGGKFPIAYSLAIIASAIAASIIASLLSPPRPEPDAGVAQSDER